MLGSIVAFFAELQWFQFLPLMVVTLFLVLYFLDSLAYWNRRIQTVTKTDLPLVPEGQDSLRYLDDHYGRIQWRYETQERSRFWYILSNWKMNPTKTYRPSREPNPGPTI